MSRALVSFSCGAASAVAAKYAVDRYEDIEVIYCNTLKYEHPDNLRFLHDVEKWLGREIKILASEKYTDIFDVFDKTGYLVGPRGARCTTELKINVRKRFQRFDDIHVLGFTSEEYDRANSFVNNNPELITDFILLRNGVSKKECIKKLVLAGIRLPEMYLKGYKNNNCIGCVKGQAGYWNKIRVDFPEAFRKMAEQERKMDVAINKRYEGKTRIRVFLDELDPNAGRYEVEGDFTCGVWCGSQLLDEY